MCTWVGINNFEFGVKCVYQRTPFSICFPGPVVNTVLDNVMKVLLVNLSPSKDPDVRSKFFSLLSHLVTSSSNTTNSERR